MYVAKTKALISFAVTAKLICVFVFAYAHRWFSHDAALILTLNCPKRINRYSKHFEMTSGFNSFCALLQSLCRTS